MSRLGGTGYPQIPYPQQPPSPDALASYFVDARRSTAPTPVSPYGRWLNDAWTYPSPVQKRPRRRVPRWIAPVAGLVVLLLLALAVIPAAVSHVGDTNAAPAANWTPLPAPPAGGGSATAYRLEFEHPSGSDHHVGWTPCSLLRYKTNLADAPAGALSDVQEALYRIEMTTGLRFSYTGTTDFVPAADHEGTYPSGTDVVIAWSDPDHAPRLSGATLGVGGASVVTAGDSAHLTEGGLTLDASEQLHSGFAGGITWGGVLLHEMGHVLGLDHETADPTQLMYPEADAQMQAWYQSGDTAGLRRLGYDPATCGP